MFATPQATAESASDFIARITRIAKRINVDDQLLQISILAGLKPELRTHVLQSQPTTIDELTRAARITDAAVTTSDAGLSQVLDEIRSSNALHAKHNASFQQLTERLDKMQVSPLGDNGAATQQFTQPTAFSVARPRSTETIRRPPASSVIPSTTRQPSGQGPVHALQ